MEWVSRNNLNHLLTAGHQKEVPNYLRFSERRQRSQYYYDNLKENCNIKKSTFILYPGGVIPNTMVVSFDDDGGSSSF